MKPGLTCILLGACIGCAGSSASSSSPAATTSAPVKTAPKKSESKVGKVGRPAALFYRNTENPTLSGIVQVDLEKLMNVAESERRPVVLSFAAKYCEPCRKELKAYAADPKPIHDSGAVFVVIVNDKDKSERTAMIKMLKEDFKLPFPIIDDEKQILSRQYGVGSLPHTTLVGRDGKIGWVNTGYAASKALAELLEAIKAAR